MRPQHKCEMRHFYFEGERDNIDKLKEKRNKDVQKKASVIQICRLIYYFVFVKDTDKL